MSKLTTMESEYVDRIDYRFDKNDSKTKEIFNTVTEALYKEFLVNPSISNLRIKLEDIINDDQEELTMENRIKLSILKSRYEINKGFNNKKHYMYDVNDIINPRNNEIVEAIRKVVMAQNNEEYYKIIMYYIMYLYLKCKKNIMFDYITDKLEKELDLEINSIDKFNDIFTDGEKMQLYASDKDNDVKKAIFNYYGFKSNDYKYKENLQEMIDKMLTDDFTEYGKVKYVDNSLSAIKAGLPAVEKIIDKKYANPSIK